MKKKLSLKIIGIILVSISGTILTVVTGGMALPAVVTSIASVAGALGTGMITLDAALQNPDAVQAGPIIKK